MAQIIFENVNESKQPCSGVYRWYFLHKKQPIVLYVGQAGAKKSWHKKSTLARAVSEASRSTFSADSYKGTMYTKLDTDFIVGTCVMYVIEELKIDCIWQHIDNDPQKERNYVQELNPIIQDEHGRICTSLKCKKETNHYWKITP